MKLTAEQKSILAGEKGAGTKKAMEILVALGKIFNAQEMIPIASAQISGVSYKNIGDAGLDFLRDWAARGAKAVVPAFMNPAGIDRTLWQQLGIPKHFAHKQLEIIAQLQQMGVEPTLTCTPYHIGKSPAAGQHLAWSESSAVSYANSVLGARTNREGGPSALSAAIAGYTPRFGLHLEQNRRATHLVTISCKLNSTADYGALGYWLGKQIGSGIPYIKGLELPDSPDQQTTSLKALGAAMAASGAVALYHIHQFTPEALQQGEKLLAANAIKLKLEDLKLATAALQRHQGKLDLVTLGCPHSSLWELKNIAQMIAGKKLAIPLWITTSEVIRQQAEKEGITPILKQSGVTIIADTCMVVAPLNELGFKYIAVNSAKAAHYLPAHQGMITYWGSTEQCIQAAIEGKWKF